MPAYLGSDWTVSHARLDECLHVSGDFQSSSLYSCIPSALTPPRYRSKHDKPSGRQFAMNHHDMGQKAETA